MPLRKIKNISFLASLAVHLLVIMIFYVISFPVHLNEAEFVTVGFGTFGKASKLKTVINRSSKKEKVKLPAIKHPSKNSAAITKKAKKKKLKKKKKEKEKSQQQFLGNYGFQIDFGGKGIRKIYSYQLPAYPSGVSKNIDIKLRFSILPDGTVANIFPLIKADTRLEMAAINSLRQWRFEPIPKNQKQIVQTAVIVFPYRVQ